MIDGIFYIAVVAALIYGFWLILSGLFAGRRDEYLLAFDDADEVSAAL